MPEGSRALAGIGCHFLVQWMDRRSEACTHMGGEGVPWMGQAPFTETRHVFANLGDGTYFHSGSLAIRQAIAAGVNITFKLLYNGAVAMTGGQPVDGEMSLPDMVAQLQAEGVSRIAVVSEAPARHRGALPKGVSVHHRDGFDAVQRELREQPGCSVLIYDQMCATESRRQRKRGLAVAPPQRVFINERVCEGCGDCSVQSNCLSILPQETEYGRKRRIDQVSCNQDLTCLKGFCPSFVTVKGGVLRRAAPGSLRPTLLPEPTRPRLESEPLNMLVAGIGGLGVTTLSAVIAMAAHLEARNVRVMDQLGMAQKGGGVHAHIRIAPRDVPLHSPRVGDGQADVVLAADQIVAHGAAVLPACGATRTHIVADGQLAPTAEFVLNNDTRYARDAVRDRLQAHSRKFEELSATQQVTEALGDPVFANVFLLGFAYQLGLVPIGAAALERAMELNGAAVEENLAAFRLGRQQALGQGTRREEGVGTEQPRSLDALVAARSEELTAYADGKYAGQYAAFVQQVHEAERKAVPASDALARAVANGLFKLMAYKDEYEVARLYTAPEFTEQLRKQFDGDLKLQFQFAPPLLTWLTGRPRKYAVGQWAWPLLGLLARAKGLRGAWLDIFGYSAERRMERALINEYRERIEGLLPRLTPATHDLLVEHAAVAEEIRGFAHIKMDSVANARARFDALEAQVLAGAQTGDERMLAHA